MNQHTRASQSEDQMTKPPTRALRAPARWLRCLAVPLLIILAAPPVARAAPDAPATTITVTTVNDEIASGGLCSLREAITAANTHAVFNECVGGPGVNTISLGPGTYQLTILGTGELANADGDLNITSSMIISGANASTTIIEGGPAFNEGIVHVSGPVVVQFNNLTIRKGLWADFVEGLEKTLTPRDRPRITTPKPDHRSAIGRCHLCDS